MKYEKLILLFIAGAMTVITELDLLPQIHHMGFLCGDPKLSYKYTGDTVTAKYLLLLSYLMPLIILIDRSLHNSSYSNFITMFVTFTIGYCLCISSVNFFKILFGEPRPHFFDTCKPLEINQCTERKYITEFKCTNDNLRLARDSIKSFPSGHSALSTFSAVYVLLYIYNQPSSSQKLIVQTLCILWILSCTVTRIIDRRHHWWDVLSGIAYGTGLAVLTLR